MRFAFPAFTMRAFAIRAFTIRYAFVLSLVLHALALWGWHVRLPFEAGMLGKPTGSLAVRMVPIEGAPPMAPAPSAPPTPRVLSQPVQSQSASASSATSAMRAPAAPRALASDRPSAASIPATPSQPQVGDLASYIEARRRAREPEQAPAPQAPAESEQQRQNRQAAANLGFDRTPSFGADKPGGGIFQIWRIGREDAEFGFYGLNRNIGRNAMQMIEVRRGTNPTIEHAIVRRMIAVIRERTSGDFEWDSKRLHRSVTLSARAEDNAGLEDFLMREFFSEERPR